MYNLRLWLVSMILLKLGLKRKDMAANYSSIEPGKKNDPSRLWKQTYPTQNTTINIKLSPRAAQW